MHPNLTHFRDFLYLSSTLVTSSTKENKKLKLRKRKEPFHRFLWAMTAPLSIAAFSHTTHSYPISSPAYIYPSTPLSFWPLHRMFVHHCGIENCGISHSIPLCPNSFTYKFPLQWVVGLLQGLWLLIPHWYWILTETLLEYPAVAQSLPSPAPEAHR